MEIDISCVTFIGYWTTRRDQAIRWLIGLATSSMAFLQGEPVRRLSEGAPVDQPPCAASMPALGAPFVALY